MKLRDYANRLVRRRCGLTDSVVSGDGAVLIAFAVPSWVTGRCDGAGHGPDGTELVRVRLWPKWWAWPLIALAWAAGAGE